MLVSIGVEHISKNLSFRFLNDKMTELIGKFKIMETCEVRKHSTVRHKWRNMFLCIGKNNMRSTSNQGAVVIPKRIHLLEVLASDFKNTIFKTTSDTLGKSQKKSSVATILNAAKIYNASQIIQLRRACNIEKDDTNITSSSTSTRRN